MPFLRKASRLTTVNGRVSGWYLVFKTTTTCGPNLPNQSVVPSTYVVLSSSESPDVSR